MIAWVTSYPRSGNHLFRTVLARSYDLGSYTAYQSAIGKAGKLTEIVGEIRFNEETSEEVLEMARASPDLFIVKTRDFLPEANACI